MNQKTDPPFPCRETMRADLSKGGLKMKLKERDPFQGAGAGKGGYHFRLSGERCSIFTTNYIKPGCGMFWCGMSRAVHAADGYAELRTSRRVPGDIGTRSNQYGYGIATANMDSIPMVVFTGQSIHGLNRQRCVPECDITGITRPCTKHNFLVRNIEDLTETIKPSGSHAPAVRDRFSSIFRKMSWPRKRIQPRNLETPENGCRL